MKESWQTTWLSDANQIVIKSELGIKDLQSTWSLCSHEQLKKQVCPEGVRVIYEAMLLLAVDVRVYFPSSINLGNLGKDMNQSRKRDY